VDGDDVTDQTYRTNATRRAGLIRRIRLDRRWRVGDTLTVDARWTPCPAGDDPGGARHGDLLVTAAGELDMATEPALVRAVVRAVDRHHPQRLRLDLAGLQFIDARGIGALITCRQAADAAGAAFVIFPAGKRVHDILWLTGLQELLVPDGRQR
jgi:anti-anti-sigma factor